MPGETIPQLPFELAALPHQLFGWLQLPVVSYALPALIAIGQVRHHHRPSWNPVLALSSRSTCPRHASLAARNSAIDRRISRSDAAHQLRRDEPRVRRPKDHAVVAEGVRFLRDSMRPDGSWPIDTNLSTWVTTLSVNALAAFPGQHPLDAAARRSIRDWLLEQQYREEHPYTHAAPGGWAWTPLPGGVPDADDTAGALLALRNLGAIDEDEALRAERGPLAARSAEQRRWDADILPRLGQASVRSQWRGPDCPRTLRLASMASGSGKRRVHCAQHAIVRAAAYLGRTQNADGSWTPLWFGNEHVAGEENRTYGTARTVIALAHRDMPMLLKAIRWLGAVQNPDGGWGGAPGTPSSIEETALAIRRCPAQGTPVPRNPDRARRPMADRSDGSRRPNATRPSDCTSRAYGISRNSIP